MVNIDYLYNPEAVKERFKKNYFIDKKLGFRVIENGTVLPHKDSIIDGKWTHGKGGIVDSNGEYIKEGFAVPRLSQGSYIPPPNQFNTAIKP